MRSFFIFIYQTLPPGNWMIWTEGSIIEIIGFKENPVKIMKGALGFPQASRYLSDFEPGKYPEVVETILRLMDGKSFFIEVDGRFTKP